MSEDRKAKIRERYKGNSAADIKVIPALEQPSFYEDFSEKRVAVYARVSTGSANQTSSYIGNKNTKVFHYPGCSSVSRMKESNMVEITGRDQAIKKGYKPCGRCTP